MPNDPPIYMTQIDAAALLECLGSNDDLGIVLRTHLEIERAMIRLLEVKFPNYAALNHNSFAQHLKALRSLGMTGGALQIADQVNKIRNIVTHVKKDMKTRLSQGDLDELCSQAAGVFGKKADVLAFCMGVGPGPRRPLRDCTLGVQFAAIGFMAAALIDSIPQRENRVLLDMTA